MANNVYTKSALAAIVFVTQGGWAVAGEQSIEGWYLRTGPVGVFFSPSVDLSMGGAPVPGADVEVDENFAISLDIGYRFSEQWSATLTIGTPPEAELIGAGSLPPVALGKLRYGPGILAGQYRFKSNNPRFQPYIGAGLNYVVNLGESDGAASDLKIKTKVGPMVQIGFESMVTEDVGLYFDVKKLWAEADVSGSIGGAPFDAEVTLDPLIVGTGIIWRF
ncbi:outer membrane beta-barrel protein [Salipiger sp. P9]|uniref:OmpW/AlkL family protein n=1 Tax=Salipiger pentaromativorans TaxID=2943193 RepID=UPI0021587E9D|nr:OmpW family outer membrane protein [Salipiger pentaromativorans]MCR8551062.1 outer membrane beta-barrel protein [Salipiger pentaromativorans]